MTQVEALLTARARLDAGGARGGCDKFRMTAGAGLPTAAVRRSASELQSAALFVDDTSFQRSAGLAALMPVIDHMRALHAAASMSAWLRRRIWAIATAEVVELAALCIRFLVGTGEHGSVEEVLRRDTGSASMWSICIAREMLPPMAKSWSGSIAHWHYWFTGVSLDLQLPAIGIARARWRTGPEVSRHADRLKDRGADGGVATGGRVITQPECRGCAPRAQLPEELTGAQVPWSVASQASRGSGLAEREASVFVGNFGARAECRRRCTGWRRK